METMVYDSMETTLSVGLCKTQQVPKFVRVCLWKSVFSNVLATRLYDGDRIDRSMVWHPGRKNDNLARALVGERVGKRLFFVPTKRLEYNYLHSPQRFP